MAAESIKEMGSSVRSKYDDDDCPAAFTILIRTSSDSTPDGPSEKISILIRDDEGRATDKQALRYSHTHPTPFQRGHVSFPAGELIFAKLLNIDFFGKFRRTIDFSLTYRLSAKIIDF